MHILIVWLAVALTTQQLELSIQPKLMYLPEIKGKYSIVKEEIYPNSS